MDPASAAGASLGGGNPGIELSVQVAVDSEGLPDEAACHRWVEAALGPRVAGGAQLSLRIVDGDEMTRLNETYRRRPGPTNVLSFPCDCGDLVSPPLLGDIVVCAERVVDEADRQGKPIEDHWAHLVVHGCLHLLGHDHESPEEAEAMESLEVAILAALGIPDPYRPAAGGAARTAGEP